MSASQQKKKNAGNANEWVARLSSELSTFNQHPQQISNQMQALLRTLQNLGGNDKRLLSLEGKTKRLLSLSRKYEINRWGVFLSVVYFNISPEVFLLCTFSIPARWFTIKHQIDLIPKIWTWWQSASRSEALTALANSFQHSIITTLSKFRDHKSLEKGILELNIPGKEAQENVQSKELHYAVVCRQPTEVKEAQEEVRNKEPQNGVVRRSSGGGSNHSYTSKISVSDLHSFLNGAQKDQYLTLNVGVNGLSWIEIPPGFCQRLLIHVHDRVAVGEQGASYFG